MTLVKKTCLCGIAESMQRYVFDGEDGKIGLEPKNLVSSTSFLLEQKLVIVFLNFKICLYNSPFLFFYVMFLLFLVSNGMFFDIKRAAKNQCNSNVFSLSVIDSWIQLMLCHNIWIFGGGSGTEGHTMTCTWNTLCRALSVLYNKPIISLSPISSFCYSHDEMGFLFP